MVSQSDWFGSWPLVVPNKVKTNHKMGPISDISGLVRLLAARGAQKSTNEPQDGPNKRHLWTPKRSKRNVFTIVIKTQNIR